VRICAADQPVECESIDEAPDIFVAPARERSDEAASLMGEQKLEVDLFVYLTYIVGET
jgi:hypothetical protein